MLEPKKAEIEGKEITFACVHFRTFPPLSAIVGVTPEQLRDQGKMSPQDYQQAKVWERICGLTEMDLYGKCVDCPHIRYLEKRTGGKPPCLTTLDGKMKTPLVDIPTLAATPRFRNPGVVGGRKGTPNSGQNAQWVDNANEIDKDAE